MNLFNILLLNTMQWVCDLSEFWYFNYVITLQRDHYILEICFISCIFASLIILIE